MHETNYETPSTDDRRIWELWLSHTYQIAIMAADEAGIVAALEREAATIPALAARLDLDERATGIVVRLLAALDLLAMRGGSYQTTDQGRLYLDRASPFYWGHMMRVGLNMAAKDRLLAKLKQKGSAEAAGPEAHAALAAGETPAEGWAAGKITPALAQSIAAGMHSHSLPAAVGAARNYDFEGIRQILDVGGGSGVFMIAFAQAHPALTSTIMDLAEMCTIAGRYIDEAGVRGRVDTRAVDMFREAWPQGYDAVFMSNVWHDWNFTTCAWLAKQAYEILPPGGRIMLHEMLLDDGGNGSATAAGFSLLMLLNTEGQQFTFDEISTLLEGAGFADVTAQHTAGHHSIVTGFKP